MSLLTSRPTRWHLADPHATMRPMMRALSAVLAALCVVGLAACPPAAAPIEPVKPTQPTPPPDAPPAPVALDQDLPRLAERATKLYQEVAAAFAAAGENCTDATTRLSTLQKANADVIAANAKVLHDGRARALRMALEPHAEALDAAAKAIVDSKTMTKCSGDRTFTDTFDELVGAPP